MKANPPIIATFHPRYRRRYYNVQIAPFAFCNRVRDAILGGMAARIPVGTKSSRTSPQARSRSRPRPSALVRAEHGGAPVHLTPAEKRVFNEALRLGADLAGEVEAKVSAYGRWLLEAVFGNDAGAALDERTKNPVWQEIIRRAGGPTLRIGKRMLYIAVRLAAYDKRITDQTWRGLDSGRKELLFPLREDRRLREAAQHVTKWNLTQTKTSAYVSELLAETGQAPAVRLTGPLLMGRIKKMHESLSGPALLRKVRAIRADLEPAERQEIAGEIEKVREVLTAIAREMRGR